MLLPDGVPHPIVVFLMWERNAPHPPGRQSVSSNFWLFTFAGDIGLTVAVATGFFLTEFQICSFWYFSLKGGYAACIPAGWKSPYTLYSNKEKQRS